MKQNNYIYDFKTFETKLYEGQIFNFSAFKNVDIKDIKVLGKSLYITINFKDLEEDNYPDIKLKIRGIENIEDVKLITKDLTNINVELELKDGIEINPDELSTYDKAMYKLYLQRLTIYEYYDDEYDKYDEEINKEIIVQFVGDMTASITNYIEIQKGYLFVKGDRLTFMDYMKKFALKFMSLFEK